VIDRCDPQGHFVHRWVPELAHIAPDQLGEPPPVKGYPSQILNYAEARTRRQKQIDEQRYEVIHSPNVVSLITRLPKDVTPFGADLVPSDVTWAQQPIEDLFPTCLDLDGLDKQQVKQIRTWFVAQGSWLSNPKRQQFAKKQNRKQRQPQIGNDQMDKDQMDIGQTDNGQLSLLM